MMDFRHLLAKLEMRIDDWNEGAEDAEERVCSVAETLVEALITACNQDRTLHDAIQKALDNAIAGQQLDRRESERIDGG